MSSLRGARISGKRALSAPTTAAVSSTESVVWVRKARLAGVGTSTACGILDRLDEGHRSRRHLPEGADHLRMAGMADEEDVAAFLDQALRLAMNLGDERAGRIDISQAAVLRRGRHRLRHAVGGEDDRTIVRHFVQLVDEDRAHALQPFDDEAVMDDLVADEDGRAEPLERQLDDLDRAVDAGAESSRGGNQDAQGRLGFGLGSAIRGPCKASLAAFEGASYELLRLVQAAKEPKPSEASPYPADDPCPPAGLQPRRRASSRAASTSAAAPARSPESRPAPATSLCSIRRTASRPTRST